MNHLQKEPDPLIDPFMMTPLRVLHLESNRQDSDRVSTMLTDGGIPCVIQRVETQPSFASALNEGRIDLILAELTTRGFDGRSALELAQKLVPHIPFIFVSATPQEKLGVEQWHRGAREYISKERLGRLIPAVYRILRDRRARTDGIGEEETVPESQLQLQQIQKLEAVGRLAGGLAHDFNNLLTVIMGHSQVLLSEMDQDHPLRSRVEEMQKAGERARVLIRQLMMFSRKRPSEARVVSLNTILDDFESMLRRLIGEDIQFTLRLSPDDLRIKADPTLVEQIVMNLVVNARDAMPTGGKLTIETSSARLTHAPMYYGNEVPPGEYVRLSVSDTGCGMTPEVQARMFKPFFTTKDEEKGTGLGLSTVFDIVTQSRGGLDVESKIGEGTRFDVYFPRVITEVDVSTGGPVVVQPIGGQETILLVEDDETVRVLIRDELRKLGYRIVEARNGIEACLVATPYMGKLQLLLADIVMPGMSGTELARHLRAIKPELKSVFISGYADDVGIGAGDSLIAFLQKPFTPQVLAGTVRQLLDLKPKEHMTIGQAAETREPTPTPKRS